MGSLADDYMAARLEADRPKRPRRVEDLPRKSDRSRQVRDDIYAMGNDGAPGPVLGRDYAIGAAAMTPAGVDTLWRMGGGNPSLTDNAQSRSLFEAARNRAPASDVPTLPEVQATARKPSLATRARAMGADAMAGGQEALQGLGSAAMSVGMGAARSTVDPTYLPRLAAPVLRAAVVDPALNAPRQMGEGGRTLREQGYELARPTLARAAGNTALAALTAADAPMLARGVAGLARGARAAPVAARAAEGAAVREAAPMANYADDAPTDGQPLFRVDPTPRPASGGNSGIAGLGLAAAGGALAAPDDARAQEAAAGERDDGLAIAQERVATLDRQIGLLSGFDASDPIAVAQVQRQIGARVDGQLGPETRAAIAQRLTQLQQERAFAQSQAQKAMQTAEDQRQAEMVERLSPKPEDLAKQEMLLAAAGLGGLIFAKTGLPIPRSLPGVGRFSGAGGRAGNVYATEQRLARDMVRADAMKFSSKMPQSDADLAKRVANVNQYWSYGGASPGRVPFRVGRGPAPTIRRNATEAPALFRPPRYNAGDATAMSAAGLDVGFSTVRLEEAKAKLKEAEADYNADTGSEAKLRRVMDLRKEVMAWQTAQAAGAGYLGGRVTAGLERPGNKLPRPNYAAAQTEQGRLANYISLNAPPPQSGGRRLLTSPPPQTPSASPVPAKARSRTRAPAVGSDAHIQGVADRARAAGFDIQKARTTSGTYDAMILRAQTDPKFRDWLAQNWQVIQ